LELIEDLQAIRDGRAVKGNQRQEKSKYDKKVEEKGGYLI